jgi:broad specificity phosphatase PhoE
LTAHGRQQADTVADQLRHLAHPVVYISPMPRTFQTILPYLTDVLGIDEVILQKKFDEQLIQFHHLFDQDNLIRYIVNEE